MYKVAHKPVTALEWRCCPGYSGYDCMEGHPAYQHAIKSFPPFKGPPMKGPQYNAPMFGRPMVKGPPFNPAVNANPWEQPKGPPTSGFNPYASRFFGLSRSSPYPDSSFEPYPPEPEPMPEHQEPHHTEHGQEHDHEHEHGHEQEHEQEHHLELSQVPEEHLPEEIPIPSPEEQPEGETTGVFLVL